MKPLLKETYREGDTPTDRLRNKLSPVFFLIELLKSRELNLISLGEKELNKMLDETANQIDLNSLRNHIDDAAELLKFYSNGSYGKRDQYV